MTYNMTVIIKDPKTEAGKNSELMFKLTAYFTHDPDTYGNGYYVKIVNDTEHYENIYDLRYDTEFSIKYAIAWLADWANTYWNGYNGAYMLESIDIRRTAAL